MKRLWYKSPAKIWDEALPLGNGRLGCMVHGRVNNEMIQLNEDSIWTGKPLDRHNKDARKNLDKLRTLIRKGKIAEAERLALLAFAGTPNSQRSYQTAGEWYLDFAEHEDATDYQRELTLDDGITRVEYKVGDTQFKRETFISYPDGVLVMHLVAVGSQKLNFVNRLERCVNWTDEVFSDSESSISFLANTGKDAISFCVSLKAGESDGQVEVIGESLTISDATYVTLYLSICTSFRYAHVKNACKEKVEQAIAKGYQAIKESHLQDYRNLFLRVELSFAGEEAEEDVPTNVRLENVKSGKTDLNLVSTYYQYGRYLMIAGSREGSLPTTLQGIWNNSLTPRWQSKYTININTEMNYWPAESTNLSECHLPYFDMLERVKENGKKTAEVMYGCRGSMAHHNIDWWADTAPQDHYIPATFWVLGEAWLATHIWERYLYTKDEKFLRKHFDVLEQCVTFFYDFMIKGPDGSLVLSPSVSPENTYIMPDKTKGCICEGATMDTQILKELFSGYIESCKVLEIEDEKREKAIAFVSRLPKYRIGKYGQLQEWLYDYDEEEPGHRHISHLYAVYPGTTFSYEKTPELMAAARKTLERRLSFGSGHTGWSRAWIIVLWTRFKEAELAYENFIELLVGSTFPNLTNNHPAEDGFIFQVEGNYGATAAITEMLLQNHDDKVVLLPALPRAMKTGSVKGIKAKGGLTVNMKWRDGQVEGLNITSICDLTKKIVVNGVEKIVLFKTGETTQIL
jgi:alpha-L-fucosidase 2